MDITLNLDRADEQALWAALESLNAALERENHTPMTMEQYIRWLVIDAIRQRAGTAPPGAPTTPRRSRPQ